MTRGDLIFLGFVFLVMIAGGSIGSLAVGPEVDKRCLDKNSPAMDSLIQQYYFLEIENEVQREVFDGEIWEDISSGFGKVNHAWRYLNPGDTMWVTKDSTRKTIVSYER